jgi:hypothetical protein
MPVDGLAVAPAFADPIIGGYGSRISARSDRLSGTTIGFDLQTAKAIVILSEAKQSMAQQADRWIALLRSQ